MTHAPIAPRPIDPFPNDSLLTAAVVAFGLSFLLVGATLVTLSIITAVGSYPVVIGAAVFLGGLLSFVASVLVVRRVRRRVVTRVA
ncbi:hypothetical protein [Natrialba sp. SSL1]|uniref:hypothetical protein n=1 Tax=Natrialba sp. SSL1 TaxID=1869245 RepID=UPI0008F9454B|nr:hypothetical protein [Natrialba sp. SSL1]OIB58491.1 hypothetical protein BBD46_09240 [Natrialba sp. SSL1]